MLQTGDILHYISVGELRICRYWWAFVAIVLNVSTCDDVGRVRSMVESGLYIYWLANAIPAVTTCRFSPSIILVQEPLSLSNLWVSLLAHSIVCLRNVYR